jgi:antitoxin FitA
MFMAQFVVRNIEDAVKLRLQRRAARHGRSMEEEVREILRSALNEENVPSGGVGTEIASLFSRVGLVADIPELKGHAIEPVEFEENVTDARKHREQAHGRRPTGKNQGLRK